MIFLDQDGVLADFDTHVLSYGIKNRHDFIHRPRSEWTEEDKEVDRRVTEVMAKPGFWASIPVMPRAHDLVEICQRYWPNGVAVLTARPKAEDTNWVAKEKYGWIVDTFGMLPFYCVLRSEKKLFANEDSLLIDDMRSNCEEWTKHGGEAILYRNPEEDYYRVVRYFEHDFSEAYKGQ